MSFKAQSSSQSRNPSNEMTPGASAAPDGLGAPGEPTAEAGLSSAADSVVPPTRAIEVEQKFRVHDRQTLLQTLSERLWQTSEAVEQEDWYLQHPSRNFAATDEALRLRRQDQRYWVTYKGPRQAGPVKKRHEIELPVTPVLQNSATSDADLQADGTAWLELFQHLGFTPVIAVRKIRQVWEHSAYPRVHVCCDEVEGLGCFVEVEMVVQQDDSEAAATGVLRIAAELGLKEVVAASYLEMLLQKPQGK